jgi:vancomycin resistance protein YoaR
MLWARRLGGAALVAAWLVWLFWGSHQWTRRLLYAARPGVTLDGHPVTGLLAWELESLVRVLAQTVEFPPREAGRERVTGRLIPHLPGVSVDMPATVGEVLSAQAGSQLRLQLLTVPPRHTTADILTLTHALGGYATVLSGSAGRRENIRLAASLLNYTLLYPGQSFSFNLTIGPITEARGFRKAPVIIGEELVPGVGGGVCQVATTLFNAAVSAGLSILERHGHSRPVSYVPPGRDATVAQYYKDLRFRNITKDPVLIRAGSDGHRVWFVILGPHRPGP